MSTSGPTWVGQLALGHGDRVTPVMRPLAPTDVTARVWVRLDGAPVGFVEVPVADGALDETAVHTAVADRFPEVWARSRGPRPEGGCGTEPTSATSGQANALDPVSVVVATKNRSTLMTQSLYSLAEMEYPSFEVLLVDGSSDGRTKDAFDRSVGDDHRFRYVAEPRPGLSLARNVGVSQASHELVAFTDDDCLVDQHWLRFLAGPFGRSPEVACVTGMVPSADLRTPAQRYFDTRVWWSSQLQPRTFTAEPEPGDSPLYPFHVGMYGTGANFAMRRTAVRELGWFSELLGAGSPCRGGGEDQDMFMRVVRSGRHLAYEPRAVVWHEGRVSDEDLRTQMQDYGRGIMISSLKWLSDPALRWDVARRIPLAAKYYIGLVASKGAADPGHGGGMAWAELRAMPGGLSSFVRGYRQWRHDSSGFDPRPARLGRGGTTGGRRCDQGEHVR